MRLILSFSLALTAVTSLAAQTTPANFHAAHEAWRAGDYPGALDQLERLLTGPDAAQVLAPAALLTGELYRTVEVAPDGTGPTWSPDGRFAAYQTGTGADLQVHVVMVQGTDVREVATVGGFSPSFSGDGRVAVMRLTRVDELERAVAELRRAVRDAASFAEFRREAARLRAEHTELVVLHVEGGRTEAIDAPALAVYDATFGPDGWLYAAAGVAGDAARTDIYIVRPGAAPRAVTDGPGIKRNARIVLGGSHVAFTVDDEAVIVQHLESAAGHRIDAREPAFSADGRFIAHVRSDGEERVVEVTGLERGAKPVVVTRTTDRVANPAISPNGSRVAWQQMPREDWELWVGTVGGGARRLTYEIQHDLFPRFLTSDLILAVIGEGRHRRSYLYHFQSGSRTRLFHNNTLRTVAPEYEWAASPDGSKVLIVSERDGDTISPERGLYLVDLAQRLTRDDVLARVRAMLADERALRVAGERMFAPAADAVRTAVRDVSKERIYQYEADLFELGSKYITQPGNAKAIEYLAAKLREFGYEPELQWFQPRGRRTANVIATLRGTIDPDVTYVVSSHFDSVERGAGADDNTSGTTALLEAARVLARRPQAATIKFAFFTGEEAGLLGSREFVRRAVADSVLVVGALNNDMIGYANDERLDNTIRYSNAGIRDLQHAAAFLFTDLILYDAKYYKSTDAHAYYDAYGDIVGGIGSYPILGNPHYHQEHDVLETINHQLVAEVSRTTVASIMLMASSPSRLTGLVVKQTGRGVTATWNAAVESDVTRYRVTWGPADAPARSSREVTAPRIDLGNVPDGTVVRVRAVNRRGLESWDWALVLAGR
jgi:hypothetical protein